jgi:hypothetical protein
VIRGSMASSISPLCRSRATRMTLPCSTNWARRAGSWSPSQPTPRAYLKKPVSDVTAPTAGAASVGAQTSAPAPSLFDCQPHDLGHDLKAFYVLYYRTGRTTVGAGTLKLQDLPAVARGRERNWQAPCADVLADGVARRHCGVAPTTTSTNQVFPILCDSVRTSVNWRVRPSSRPMIQARFAAVVLVRIVSTGAAASAGEVALAISLSLGPWHSRD